MGVRRHERGVKGGGTRVRDRGERWRYEDVRGVVRGRGTTGRDGGGRWGTRARERGER